MNYEEYRELYVAALKLDEEFEPVNLPVELKRGETEEEAFLRFLIEEELIEVDENHWKITDREKVSNFNPNLLKLLDAIIMSSVMTETDELIELGILYMSADEEGNIIYELTELGKKYAEDN